jgi:anti-sigma B factor antagonist
MQEHHGELMKVLLNSDAHVVRATLSEGEALDQRNASFVRDEITKRLVPGGVLLVSLDSIRSVDSAGVGALVTLLKTVRRQGGRMALLEVRPQILSVLEIIRLNTIFEIFPDEKAALAAFASTRTPTTTRS